MQCSSLKPKFHMILRSRGKKREISMSILPEEIIFTILILLPAHLLHNVMRYVCRQWYRIIEDPQFVTAHCLLSTTTLLMYRPETSFYHLLDARECGAKRTGFLFSLPHTDMMNTCNGLMLILRESWEPFSNKYTYYVGNPVTRKTLELPRLSLPTFRYRCCLAFEACSKVYKVVLVYMTEKHSYGPFNPNLGCAILTVGVDAEWRVVSCAHLEEEDMKLLMLGSPVTSTGLVYWSSILHHNIMVLDIKSETIKTISLPYAYGTSYPCLPKGNSISIFYLNSDCSMEVWLLKDHHMNEEWVKILYIDGEPIRNQLDKPFPSKLYPGSPKYYDVRPRCWLGNDERILFEVALDVSYFFVYDVKTCSCSWFALENDDSCYSQLEPFVNTLAWVC